eukprot:TRINITY_DN4381_c0_g1_i3.p2 TRINITY_DN4381_c0_g1~~TRINITY_DN4381_c0_g1_i3.p2  ORF type:complete len:306 (+),score=50.43 TRINITY_DN4381_c0_g1_i3:65-982(+)
MLCWSHLPHSPLEVGSLEPSHVLTSVCVRRTAESAEEVSRGDARLEPQGQAAPAWWPRRPVPQEDPSPDPHWLHEAGCTFRPQICARRTAASAHAKVAVAKRRELAEQAAQARREAEDACCTFRPQICARRTAASAHAKVAAAKRRELAEQAAQARREAEDACCTFRPQISSRRQPASVGGAARQSAAELHSLPLPQQVTELEGRIERGGSGAEMDGLRRLLRVKQAQLRREQLRREREEEGGGGGGEVADQPSPGKWAHLADLPLGRDRGRRLFHPKWCAAPQGRSSSDEQESPRLRTTYCERA